MSHRRAKIVCTLGPASDGDSVIAKLIEAGMDVARLNYSHGTHAEHAARAARVREASERAGRPVALLQDLCGPKIRTGVGGPSTAASGTTLELFSGAESDGTLLPVQYEGLCEDLCVDDAILLGDGDVQLRVSAIAEGRVRCRVVHGGALRSRMGVSLPAARVRHGALTDKDFADLDHGLAIGVDFVALSFVRDAAEVRQLRERIVARGHELPIVAKIETPQAVDRIDDIVCAADAVMVARGDLGVELPPETVPVLQKRILAACRVHQTPAIVATEMLQSMVGSPRPTRAEASDVAGAVFDGADALMLSAETASGEHPVAACAMMDRIIRDAEGSSFWAPPASDPGSTAAEAIADASCDVARSVGAKLIVALTRTGSTARLVSKARPGVPVLALSPEPATLRRLALYWGVTPRFLEVVSDVDELSRRTCEYLKSSGLAALGDSYVMVYGAPLGVRGMTNAIRVERVG